MEHEQLMLVLHLTYALWFVQPGGTKIYFKKKHNQPMLVVWFDQKYIFDSLETSRSTNFITNLTVFHNPTLQVIPSHLPGEATLSLLTVLTFLNDRHTRFIFPPHVRSLLTVFTFLNDHCHTRFLFPHM